MAGKRSSGGRPSIFAVAELAGVSHQTVSRVINHSPNVSAKTRAKVERAIEELGYRPSNSARALASNRSRTVGLIAGGQRFYGPVSAMASIETVARAHDMFVSVAMVHEALCTQEEFDGLCGMFEQQGVDAFIFLTPTDAMFRAACRAKVTQPRAIITSTHGTVSVEEGLRLLRAAQRRRVSLVGVDQWGGMTGVMRMVRKYGHRNVLFFAGPAEWRDAATRLAAWNALCAQHAVSSITVQCRDWASGEAYQRMNHILDNIGSNGGRLPTCVVCSNDPMAMGVIRALLEHGVRVPQDVSVTGFDDMVGTENLYPPLTTVRQDFDDLGTMAMKEILYLMGEGDEPGYAVSRHGVGLATAQVIPRQSLRQAAQR
ncbi:LacI family DNA-binding transcriptional regulator [Bifidobacterium cuniculi]|uniref:LacI-type transcriptional regulator n=1 Tax=Bifidobacterium cuniculi TaxID=1688 RepID=A0A087B595_9BIFI|nr:LacI family DNA-binding transcriptional regulator [Bifidobacterium cuniculi]KFI66195.1 LacI-type transcriptional regulator [Bifidobacterium cuniculi]